MKTARGVSVCDATDMSFTPYGLKNAGTTFREPCTQFAAPRPWLHGRWASRARHARRACRADREAWYAYGRRCRCTWSDCSKDPRRDDRDAGRRLSDPRAISTAFEAVSTHGARLSRRRCAGDRTRTPRRRTGSTPVLSYQLISGCSPANQLSTASARSASTLVAFAFHNRSAVRRGTVGVFSTSPPALTRER